ncbi:hypothetical protein ACMGE7_02270 [Macrococcus equi]|uniref:hypothetical protein n=1 Tax=Macrococcus equi TaxID=3395462 RepID=UPI0039BDB2AB
MLAVYKRFWRLWFNNEEKDTRLQFWLPFVINSVLIGLLFYSLIWIEKLENNILFLPLFLLLLLLIGYPIMSSAIRRINDVGKDNKYYKAASRFYMIAFGLIVLVNVLKYFFNIVLIFDTQYLIEIFFAIIIVLFFIYALLPSNYFTKK